MYIIPLIGAYINLVGKEIVLKLPYGPVLPQDYFFLFLFFNKNKFLD